MEILKSQSGTGRRIEFLRLHKKWGLPKNVFNIHRDGQSVFYSLGNFFSKYGEIALIRLIDKFVSTVGFGFAYIDLKDGRCEGAIIINSTFGILVFPEKVDHALPTVLKMNLEQRSIPPEPESPSNILNALNDDCVQEIFRYLSLEDLGCVADVCMKFKANATTIFPLKHHQPGSTLNISRSHRSERLFRNFRINIKSVSIFREKFFPPIVYADNVALLNLFNYCSDPSCQFNHFTINNFSKDELRPWKHLLSPIFERLNCLQVNNCGYDEFLGHCRNLTELKMTNRYTANEIRLTSSLMNAFNNLEKLSLVGPYFDGVIKNMGPNAMLRSLSLSGVSTPIDIMPEFPNLEELECAIALIQYSGTSIPSLAQMKNLKRIILKCAGYYGIEVFENIIDLLVKANVPVEWLTIKDCFYPGNNLNVIARFNELKALEINNGIGFLRSNWMECLPKLKELHLVKSNESDWTDSIILDIVKYGTQLNYLLLDCCWRDFVIDDTVFNNILAHVMRRKEKTKLLIEIRSSENKFKMTVSSNNIKKYSDLLEIRF